MVNSRQNDAVSAFNHALVRKRALDPRNSFRVRIGPPGPRGPDPCGRSGIAREIVRPSLHQDPTPIEEIRSCVGRLDLTLDGIGQAHFGI